MKFSPITCVKSDLLYKEANTTNITSSNFKNFQITVFFFFFNNFRQQMNKQLFFFNCIQSIPQLVAIDNTFMILTTYSLPRKKKSLFKRHKVVLFSSHSTLGCRIYVRCSRHHSSKIFHRPLLVGKNFNQTPSFHDAVITSPFCLFSHTRTNSPGNGSRPHKPRRQA